jgi:hypothetical protein
MFVFEIVEMGITILIVSFHKAPSVWKLKTKICDKLNIPVFDQELSTQPKIIDLLNCDFLNVSDTAINKIYLTVQQAKRRGSI